MRVLIVDDHAGFRQQARALLEADGFEIVGEAATGAEAIAACAKLHPQLVLLDVQLPDMDGFEVSRRLQALSRLQQLNGGVDIVLTSSRDRSDYGSLVTECPVRGFVPKADVSGRAISELLG